MDGGERSAWVSGCATAEDLRGKNGLFVRREAKEVVREAEGREKGRE